MALRSLAEHETTRTMLLLSAELAQNPNLLEELRQCIAKHKSAAGKPAARTKRKTSDSAGKDEA